MNIDKVRETHAFRLQWTNIERNEAKIARKHGLFRKSYAEAIQNDIFYDTAAIK